MTLSRATLVSRVRQASDRAPRRSARDALKYPLMPLSHSQLVSVRERKKDVTQLGLEKEGSDSVRTHGTLRPSLNKYKFTEKGIRLKKKLPDFEHREDE